MTLFLKITQDWAALPDLARDKSGRDRPAGGGRVAPAGRSQPDTLRSGMLMAPCPAACAARQPSRASLPRRAAFAGWGIGFLGWFGDERLEVGCEF